MAKFWRWARNEAATPEAPETRTLYLDGPIAEESWFEDDITPGIFRSELNAGGGDITVWINSPGGDCFAAAQIYNMLREYPGKVTVKIDGLAASAASVVAMAGDEVLVSPVSNIMIHNPATIASGDHVEMEKAIAMLDKVKASIINAYQEKTGMSRNKLSQLMDSEYWMDAREAVELRFADGILPRAQRREESGEPDDGVTAVAFARVPFVRAVTNRIYDRYRIPEPKTVPVAELYARLKKIKETF